MSSAPEGLPFININLGGQEYQATPLNAQLYTFAGQTVLESGDMIDNASRDHIFLLTGSLSTETDMQTGTYVFEPAVVKQMGAVMIVHGFPCRIGQRAIPACDEKAYQTYINQQVEDVADFFPDEWSKKDGSA